VFSLIRDPAVANDSLTFPWRDEPVFDIQLKTDDTKYVEFSSVMDGNDDSSRDAKGYVVHGPALFSSEFSAKTVDDLSFRFAASDDEDDYKVFGYLLNTADCSQTEVLDSTGTIQDWTTVTVAIPSNGTYRFVFVSGTYDQNWGSAAGAYMFLDDVTLAPNAQRVAAAAAAPAAAAPAAAAPAAAAPAAATPSAKLATTGAEVVWLLTGSLLVVVAGAGLFALGRGRRSE
jgi:hypothetical protein